MIDKLMQDQREGMAFINHRSRPRFCDVRLYASMQIFVIDGADAHRLTQIWFHRIGVGRSIDLTLHKQRSAATAQVQKLSMFSSSRGAVFEHGDLIQLRPRAVRNFDSLE